MADTLKLEIVTPEDKVYSEEVDMVTLPGQEGQMGVFPRHVPLMTQVSAGEIVAKKGADEQYLAVGEGFVQIMPDKVSVLTDMAITEENIDETKAEEARKRAEDRLQEKLSDEEMATVKAALAHSLAQLNVKRRRRNM
jgi:F-type H+-transporting ATPase subunit epsilon